MIAGFEDITHPLTRYESDVLLPIFVRGLKAHVGQDNPVTSKEIIEKLKGKGFKVSGPRVRAIINHIRLNGLIPGLIASSRGYYVSDNEEEIMAYLSSLEGRISAISRVRMSMVKYLKELNQGRQMAADYGS